MPPGAMPALFNDLGNARPRILVSACLLGQQVRYDGIPKQFPAMAAFLADHAEVTAICPEVGAGLGVPRPPVQRVETGHGIRVLGVDDPGLDLTSALLQFAQQTSRQYRDTFQACVLKSRSPSCGVSSTPVFNRANEIVRYGKGVFTEQLNREWPRSIFVEEEQLQTESQRHDLLLRCYLLLDIAATGNDRLLQLVSHYEKVFERKLDMETLLALLTRAPLPPEVSGNILPS